MFQYIQALFTKSSHNTLRRLFTNTLHGPGREIGQNFIAALGHVSLQQFRFKLLAIGCMRRPVARDGQPFSHSCHGNGSHHCDLLVVLAFEAQHCITVFRILENNRRHRAVEYFALQAPASFCILLPCYNKMVRFSTC